jgi:putative SOS response-associated peptidase YedK
LLAGGRCNVPADSWYEWTDEKRREAPWHIQLKTHEPLFMAAIAHIGAHAKHKAEAGFVIVTTDAVGGMVDVHDRRPVVLTAADAATWLNRALPPNEAEHRSRVARRPPEDFDWYRVSTAVNKASNEAPDLTEPIEHFPVLPNHQ